MNGQLTQRRIAGGFLGFVGFMLSPLSWWNDLISSWTLLLALPFGWLVALILLPAFMAAAIVGYWLTNVLGFMFSCTKERRVAMNRAHALPSRSGGGSSSTGPTRCSSWHWSTSNGSRLRPACFTADHRQIARRHQLAEGWIVDVRIDQFNRDADTGGRRERFDEGCVTLGIAQLPAGDGVDRKTAAGNDHAHRPGRFVQPLRDIRATAAISSGNSRTRMEIGL